MALTMDGLTLQVNESVQEALSKLSTQEEIGEFWKSVNDFAAMMFMGPKEKVEGKE